MCSVAEVAGLVGPRSSRDFHGSAVGTCPTHTHTRTATINDVTHEQGDVTRMLHRAAHGERRALHEHSAPNTDAVLKHASQSRL